MGLFVKLSRGTNAPDADRPRSHWPPATFSPACLAHPLQRWLSDLFNLFFVPEDRDSLRPWWQLLILIVVVFLVLALMTSSCDLP